MEGFTPSFFLQLVIAVGAAFGSYIAIRKDLTNTMTGLEEEKRLREKLASDTRESFHDIRDKNLRPISETVARLDERAKLEPLLASVVEMMKGKR